MMSIKKKSLFTIYNSLLKNYRFENWNLARAPF